MWGFQGFLCSRGDVALGKGHSGLDCRDPLRDLQCCVFPRPPEQFGGGALTVSFSLGVLLDFLQMPFLDLVDEGSGIMASCVVVFFLIKKKTIVKFIAVVWIRQYLKAHYVNNFVLARTWAEVVAPLLDGS